MSREQKEELFALMSEQERRAYKKNPFDLVRAGLLCIKTKNKTFSPFVLNKAQDHFLSHVERDYKAGKVCRYNILKARQLGFSTLIEAIVYAFASCQENTNCGIIADIEDNSEELFAKTKLFHENLEDPTKPLTNRLNRKALEFHELRSQIDIFSARKKRPAQSRTYQIFHVSECAFYEQFDNVMLSVNQTVPRLKHTMTFLETTANGYDQFQGHWDQCESNKNEWQNIFYAWYWDEEYSLLAPDDFQVSEWIEHRNERIRVDEINLKEKAQSIGVAITDDQLYWRRWCLFNNCGGSMNKLNQEYPTFPEDAFIGSGNAFYNIPSLKNMLRHSEEFCLFKRGKFILDINGGVIFRENPHGYWKLFKKVENKKQYFMGGDVAEGIGKDASCLVVRQGSANENVAVYYNENCDPDQLHTEAKLSALYYNGALVAIENNNHGYTTNNLLYKVYNNVYYDETVDQRTNAVTKKIGWTTNVKTRPLMLDFSKQEIREGSVILSCTLLINQCITFIVNDKAKPEALSGKEDHLVIANAIVSFVRHEKYESSLEPDERNKDYWHCVKKDVPNQFITESGESAW